MVATPSATANTKSRGWSINEKDVLIFVNKSFIRLDCETKVEFLNTIPFRSEIKFCGKYNISTTFLRVFQGAKGIKNLDSLFYVCKYLNL